MSKKGQKKSRILRRAIKRAELRINKKIYKKIAELEKDPEIMKEIDKEAEELLKKWKSNSTNGKKVSCNMREMLRLDVADKAENLQLSQ